MTVLFWTSVGLVVYTYLGYPMCLWILSKVRPSSVRKGKISPSVSIIIAARNEADKIRQKIDNALTLDYPLTLLEVIIASDASDDGTDDIVRKYSAQGVRLVRACERKGKEHVQGLAIVEAKGEILIFTDAASILEPDVLRRVVENFADPTIGGVSTEDVIVDSAGIPTAEGLYVKYEMWVRGLESRFHSLVGLSGSCFAVRKELAIEWSLNLASDFVMALQAIRKGYRSVADQSARVRFPAVTSAHIEMRRKVRTFLRGITVLMANTDMLNPFTYGRFAFQLVSHKVFRFVTPFLLLVALGTSGLLMRDQPYFAIFWAQVGFYSLGILGAPVQVLQRNRIVRVAGYFTMVQWAMVLAWVKYMRGHHQMTWEPSKRPGVVTGSHGSTH